MNFVWSKNYEREISNVNIPVHRGVLKMGYIDISVKRLKSYNSHWIIKMGRQNSVILLHVWPCINSDYFNRSVDYYYHLLLPMFHKFKPILPQEMQLSFFEYIVKTNAYIGVTLYGFFYVHMTFIVINFFIIKPNRCTNFQIYFVIKLYMSRVVPLPIIRSLFTVHSALVYVIQVWRQLLSRTRMEQSKKKKKLKSCLLIIIKMSSYIASSRTRMVLLESCLQMSMTYTIAECTANKLLMMDRGTAWNM
jgi:hypothetical protein